jgi:hypothetical protein
MGTRPDFSPFVSKRDGLNLRLIGNRGEIMAAALFNRHALTRPGDDLHTSGRRQEETGDVNRATTERSQKSETPRTP